MKIKMLQLLLIFLMTGLLSTSRDQSVTVKYHCSLKCAAVASQTTTGKMTDADTMDEYPFAITPVSCLLRF